MTLRRSSVLCGVDEAGRGPLAGPVYAAAVVLAPDARIPGLADSKLLKPRVRAALRRTIMQTASAWAIAHATVEEIDRLNVLRAALLAMQRAVAALSTPIDEAWVDGIHCPTLAVPVRAIVRGDALIPEISAASILAKTARDDAMIDLDARFPQYGFARHKGYPTAAHLDALRRHGVSPVHRRSFAPVRALLS